MQRRSFLYAFLLLFVAGFPACGGGGGSSGTSYTPPAYGTDGAKLVGTWKRTVAACIFTAVYKNDGTYTATSADGGSESGTWKLNGTTYTQTTTAGTSSDCEQPLIGTFTYPFTINTAVTPETATATSINFSGLLFGTESIGLQKTDSTETTPTLPGTYLGYFSGCAVGQKTGGMTVNSDLTWAWTGNGTDYAGTYSVSGTTIHFATVSGTGSVCVQLPTSWNITNYVLTSGTATITKQ